MLPENLLINFRNFRRSFTTIRRLCKRRNSQFQFRLDDGVLPRFRRRNRLGTTHHWYDDYILT